MPLSSMPVSPTASSLAAAACLRFLPAAGLAAAPFALAGAGAGAGLALDGDGRAAGTRATIDDARRRRWWRRRRQPRRAARASRVSPAQTAKFSARTIWGAHSAAARPRLDGMGRTHVAACPQRLCTPRRTPSCIARPICPTGGCQSEGRIPSPSASRGAMRRGRQKKDRRERANRDDIDDQETSGPPWQ